VRRPPPANDPPRRTPASNRRRLAVALASAVLAGGLAACSGGPNAFSGPAPQRAGPVVTYVSVTEAQQDQPGDARTSWTQQFYRSSLPAWATAYELDLPSGWEFSEPSLISEVLALRPTVVTVALGLDEAFDGTGVLEFAGALRQLLVALHKAGVPTVLVANVLPLPGSPPDSSELTSLIHAYNVTIATESAAEDAVLVDAHDAFARALQTGQPVMAYGNSLTTLGENLMAGAFEAEAKHHVFWR